MAKTELNHKRRRSRQLIKPKHYYICVHAKVIITQISNRSQCSSTCGISISKAIKIQYLCLLPWIETIMQKNRIGSWRWQKCENMRWFTFPRRWRARSAHREMKTMMEQTTATIHVGVYSRDSFSSSSAMFFYQYCLAEECVDDNSFFLFNIYMFDRKW